MPRSGFESEISVLGAANCQRCHRLATKRDILVRNACPFELTFIWKSHLAVKYLKVAKIEFKPYRIFYHFYDEKVSKILTLHRRNFRRFR